MREYRVAVVGATGAVGREMLRVLERRNFPVRELRALASERSVGTRLRFRSQEVTVARLDQDSFENIDIALFSAGAERSRQYAPVAVQAGAVVIDNSSAFRMEPDVPLIVPEVNPQHLAQHHGLIANPNCSTIQMVVALQPVRQLFGLRRIVVSTYQSVSGAGQRSIEELERASRAYLAGEPEQREIYPRGIAFEVVPHIDLMDDRGHTREELKMRNETRRILDEPDLPVFATCVRVPVFRSHSEAVVVETVRPVDLEQLRVQMQRQAGLIQSSQALAYPLAREAAYEDAVYVGRLRSFEEEPRVVAMWIVSDNLLKGAALNAVQIAELVHERA